MLDIVNAASMDATYCTYVDDACFDMFYIQDYGGDTDHDPDDDTDNDTDDETTNDDTDDDTDDGGRGKLRRLLGGAEIISEMMIYDETLILDLVFARMIIPEEIRT